MRARGLTGASGARHSRSPRSAMTASTDWRIASHASSGRPHRTGCGWPTSPTSRHTPAACTWRSSSTCARALVVGRQASRSLRSDLAIDALAMAVWNRQRFVGADLSALTHHGDRGVQYLSVRYSERLAENQIVAVGRIGRRRRPRHRHSRRRHDSAAGRDRDVGSRRRHPGEAEVRARGHDLSTARTPSVTEREAEGARAARAAHDERADRSTRCSSRCEPSRATCRRCCASWACPTVAASPAPSRRLKRQYPNPRFVGANDPLWIRWVSGTDRN